MIARVITELSLDKTFDYIIPKHLEQQATIGTQVIIPFGNTIRNGYILNVATKSDFPNLKAIKAVSNDIQMTTKLLALGEWMADYYCCSKEKAIQALLPGVVRSRRVKAKLFTYYTITGEERVKNYILEKGKANKAKTRVLETLMHFNELSSSQLLSKADTSKNVLNDLVKLGYIKTDITEVNQDPFPNATLLKTNPLKLTDEQDNAVKIILKTIENLNDFNKSNSQCTSERIFNPTNPTDPIDPTDPIAPIKPPHTILLNGVTGSGKTEVYLQTIAKVLEEDKDVIVLVPEISLTPQTVERFRGRFGDKVSVLHSGLSDRDRFDEWIKVSRGQVKIAVGARSALFAPFKNLGLIVVDEEHETSYKQDKDPRYHARDVAVMRGYMENAIVILGTATPSFESFYNAKVKKYIMIELTKRIGAFKMPNIRIVDMRAERAGNENSGIFSKDLIEGVNQRLLNGEQVILFLNRRGYAKKLQCDNCGFVAQCEECSVSFTYHQKKQTLSCHLCGMVQSAPFKCPDCKSESIKYPGLGTEKIEKVANGIFQDARIRRMDSDTMTKMSSYEDTFDEFKQGNIDILIGTQMVAKGLHFPKVTLVGVLNADTSLYIPDFRAGERTFQLLTQVAGRSGRGDIEGEVIIQSYTPFNPAIQCAIKYDYDSFYEEDTFVREQFIYPPFGRILALHFKGKNEKEVANYAQSFYESIIPYLQDITSAPPAPSPIEKIKNQYRYQIIFRGSKLSKIRRILRQKVINQKHPKNIRVYIDMDAINMM